jgi:hypothetical protein
LLFLKLNLVCRGSRVQRCASGQTSSVRHRDHSAMTTVTHAW